MTGALLLAGATVLLVLGAELFTDNVTGAARRLRLSVFAVGLLLAGAEPEEAVTAVVAALRNHPGLAAGDAIGANVTMLTLTLGLAALVRPVPFGPSVRRYAVAAAVLGAAAWVALLDGGVGRLGGALLVAAYVGFVALTWRRERTIPPIGEVPDVIADAAPVATGARALLLVAVGLGLMTAGGQLAVSGATRLAETFEVTDSAVGLTLLALATTAELFALVWSAARRGLHTVAVAGILGSAAYNATLTLGLAALARPLVTGGVVPAAAMATALPVALLVLSARGRLGRASGLLLVAAYVGFVLLALR